MNRTQDPRMARVRQLSKVYGENQHTGFRPPAFDNDDMPPPPPARQAKATDPGEFTEANMDDSLAQLMEEAQAERLEFLVEAIKTFKTVKANDRYDGHTPPGLLTVRGWISLLNRWEAMTTQYRTRQIFFAKSFLQETLENSRFGLTPMAAVFQELVSLMEKTLEVPVEHVVRKVG